MSESNEVREDVMSEDDVIVRIKDLHKSYGDLEVLRGIDIDVPRAIEEIEKKDLKAEDQSEKPKSDKTKAKDNKPKEEQKG